MEVKINAVTLHPADTTRLVSLNCSANVGDETNAKGKNM
jgi:hypothetical protein